ncbi:MAG: hypothetical protein WDA75_22645 [Candidatus Latescibacterota bacterium]|jgi:hypothetical protein
MRLSAVAAFYVAVSALVTGCVPFPGRPAPLRSDAVLDSLDALGQYLHCRQQTADTTAYPTPTIAILPLQDESGFRKDVWDLPLEMARLVSAEMALLPSWRVVPFDAVAQVIGSTRRFKADQAAAIGQRLQADYILLGVIREMNMGRFSVGDPLLGGYKSYTGAVSLEVQALRVADRTEALSVTGESELTDRDVGLDLLGKPRQQDLEFAGLRDLPFGSPAFRETVLGKATLEAVGEVLDDLTPLVRPAGFMAAGRSGVVLSVQGAELYLSLGIEDGLRPGHRLEVLPGDRRSSGAAIVPGQVIAVVEVQEVIGARLSKALVVGEAVVQPGDRLRFPSP